MGQIETADFEKKYEKLIEDVSKILYPTRKGILDLLEAFKKDCLKATGRDFEIIKELRR